MLLFIIKSDHKLLLAGIQRGGCSVFRYDGLFGPKEQVSSLGPTISNHQLAHNDCINRGGILDQIEKFIWYIVSKFLIYIFIIRIIISMQYSYITFYTKKISYIFLISNFIILKQYIFFHFYILFLYFDIQEQFSYFTPLPY